MLEIRALKEDGELKETRRARSLVERRLKDRGRNFRKRRRDRRRLRRGKESEDGP